MAINTFAQVPPPAGIAAPGKPAQPPATPAAPAQPDWFFANPSNPTQWASDIVGEAGGPTSGAGYQSDLDFLAGWYPREGGNWENNASYNPLNTTLQEPGSTSINGVGVEAYQNWNQGNQATLQTLAGYPDILAALKAGDASQLDTSGDFSSELSKWSGGGYSSIPPGTVNPSQLAGGAAQTPGQQGALGSTVGGLLNDSSALSAEQNVGLAAQQTLGQGQEQITQQQLQQQLTDTLQSLGLQGQQLGIQGTQLGQQQAYQTGQYGLQQQQDVLSQQELNLEGTQARDSNAASGTYNSGTLNQALQNIGLQQSQLGLTKQGQAESNTYQNQQIQDALQRLGISKQQLAEQGTVAQQEFGTGNEQAANTYANLANQIQMQEQLNTQGNFSSLQGILDQLYTSGGFSG